MVAIGGASISIDVLNPNLQLRRQVWNDHPQGSSNPVL
jgi:hypothetical protein